MQTAWCEEHHIQPIEKLIAMKSDMYSTHVLRSMGREALVKLACSHKVHVVMSLRNLAEVEQA